MNIEDLKERHKKALEKAVLLNDAIERKKKKDEFKKLVEEERKRQEEKERKFAEPKTPDDATGTFPTLEDLAGECAPKLKTKEDILENGSFLEKIRLYISSYDLGGYFGTTGLTKEEKAKIIASIRTKEDRILLGKYIKEYEVIAEFGKRLRDAFKRFQTSFSFLAVLLNEWDSYEREALNITQILTNITGKYSDTLDKDSFKKFKEVVGKRVEEELNKIEEKPFTYSIEENEFLPINKTIYGKNGIYERAKRDAKEVEEALSDFKTYALVAQEYILKSKLKYMPIAIQMSIENAEEERYTRYLVKNLSFFRSELNYRKEQGKEITAEDEKKALIPDYFEVEPNRTVYENCKKGLKLIANGKAN